MPEAKIDVVIGGKTDAFASALQKATGILNRFMAPLAIIAFARSTAAAADQLVELSARTGVSLERLQEFSFAAQQSGSSLADFTTALRFLARAQTEALAGNDGAVQAFHRFGLELKDLKRMSADELLRAIARAVQRMGATSQVTADLLTVLGRGADVLLPAFRDGLDQLAKKAHEAGVVLRDELLLELASINDEVDRTLVELKAAGAAPVNVGLRALDTIVTVIRSTWNDLKRVAAWLVQDQNWSDSIWRRDETLWRGYSGRHGLMMFEDEGMAMAADPKATQILQRKKEVAAERLARLGELRAKNAALAKQAELDALEPAEKLNALIRERLALERQIEFADDPLRAEELRSGLFPIEAAVRQLKALRHAPEIAASHPAADALARIGGFRGGLDPTRRIEETQLGVLRSMDQKLGRIGFTLNQE